MVDTLAGKTSGNLEELLSNYKVLCDQQEDLEERLQKANQERKSVSERIYEKVIRGYQDDLEVIRSRLSPIQAEIDDFKREAEQAMEELDPKIDANNDDLAEASFRHRVGEFENNQYHEMKTRIEADLESLSARRNKIAKQLEMLSINDPKSDTAKKTEERRAPEEDFEREQPGSGYESPAGPAAQAEKTEDERATTEPDGGEQFEDPQYRRDRDRRDKYHEEKSKVDDADSSVGEFFIDDDDPLSALADPSKETPAADSRSAENDSAAGASAGYPNLVIDSGPNAGKKIPLLPMTMSIGREHDNNIELKDPDVARYHARVLYERGEFILEDLESSTGTWVNGATTKKAPLMNGDKIRFGSTNLSVKFE